jgi:AbrB family looped-hinge helix DNA binding protein
MTTLTVTARGQVTFRKDVLEHLGIRPGERIELDKLPDGRVSLKAMRFWRSILSMASTLRG